VIRFLLYSLSLSTLYVERERERERELQYVAYSSCLKDEKYVGSVQAAIPGVKYSTV
jgi:hypothetical protein